MPAPKGQVTYHDKTLGLQLKSTTLNFVAISGTHATIAGTGIVNGATVDFRIDADDLGESGSADTFRISWTGYAAGGVLDGGNIQIHR